MNVGAGSLCSDCHLTALAQYAHDQALLYELGEVSATVEATRKRMDRIRAIGQHLKDEHVKSLRVQYGERLGQLYPRHARAFAPCSHSKQLEVIDALAVFKAAQSYDDATCDNPEWPASAVRTITTRIRAHAAQEVLEKWPEYEKLEWGFRCSQGRRATP
jgi:hypothetical protein